MSFSELFPTAQYGARPVIIMGKLSPPTQLARKQQRLNRAHLSTPHRWRDGNDFGCTAIQ